MPGWHASGEQPAEDPDATTATGWLGVPSAALPLGGLAVPPAPQAATGPHRPAGAPSVSAAPSAGRSEQSRQSPPSGVTMPSGPAVPGPVAAPSVAAAGLGNSRPARNPSAPLPGTRPGSTAGSAGTDPRLRTPAAGAADGRPADPNGDTTGPASTGGGGSAGGGAFGSRGSGRAATRSSAQPPPGWGERAQPAFQSDWVSATRSDSVPQNTARRLADEDTGEQAGETGSASLVRPYARTGGRTKPVRHLDLEALVRTSNNGRDALSSPQLNPEHVNVIHMASGTVSVAEIAARLVVPLGVARVIIADMVDLGLVEVMKTSGTQGDERDPAFLRRVLSGLQRL